MSALGNGSGSFDFRGEGSVLPATQITSIGASPTLFGMYSKQVGGKRRNKSAKHGKSTKHGKMTKHSKSAKHGKSAKKYSKKFGCVRFY